MYDALAIRFWEKVDFLNPNGCWLWTRAVRKKDGYGHFRAGADTVKAHRFAYALLVGPIPDGLVLDHKCHNEATSCPGGLCLHRRCVNPAHLDPVPVGENTRRGQAAEVNRARNAARTHCKRGHEFTPENTLRGTTGRRCRTCLRLLARKYRQQKATAA